MSSRNNATEVKGSHSRGASARAGARSQGFLDVTSFFLIVRAFHNVTSSTWEPWPRKGKGGRSAEVFGFHLISFNLVANSHWFRSYICAACQPCQGLKGSRLDINVDLPSRTLNCVAAQLELLECSRDARKSLPLGRNIRSQITRRDAWVLVFNYKNSYQNEDEI
jgi:hypothetical protein